MCSWHYLLCRELYTSPYGTAITVVPNVYTAKHLTHHVFKATHCAHHHGSALCNSCRTHCSEVNNAIITTRTVSHTRVCMVQTSGSFSEQGCGKAVAGLLSLTSAQDHISRWFHSAYTHITKSSKNRLPPGIQLSSSRGSAELAYLLSHKLISKQVTHLTPEAVSTIAASHRSILLVLPLNHPFVLLGHSKADSSAEPGLARSLQLH